MSQHFLPHTTDGLRSRADAVAQVVVDDFENPVLTEDDTAHLSKVLRVRTGENVALTDGAGKWCVASWSDGRVEVSGDIYQEPAPNPRVTVGMALVKGDRPELAVQKLSEIGVDRIVLIGRTDNTVVRWDPGKIDRNLARARKIAYEAAMQSRRVWLPDVDFAESLAGFDSYGLAEPGGSEVSLDCPVVLIGPEGGWSEAERNGVRHIDLGPTVLRAETAAIVAGAHLCALRQAPIKSAL